ncbi:molybdopterin-binding protein [Adlercreutzia sp. R25]|uniref:molybdopterin-binding protein n=1 Tax=Adlercreutzia shanghongiae TaxID=3111773 RepID=UPI002DBDED02|nr:molybdopterin-binding protein [Adlercreutzia sp. R25]MEC4273689.1 molybdopterin-binding protein [Adlercreutzia sp. R25]
MIAPLFGRVGMPVKVSGYAQDFELPIVGVRFSCDDGATWTQFDIADARVERVVNWSFSFTLPRPGQYRLLVRSVRIDGAVSKESASVPITIEP